MMQNPLVAQVGIFGSGNLGDRFISAALTEHLERCGARVLKYDFLPGHDRGSGGNRLKAGLKTKKYPYLCYTFLKALKENSGKRRGYARLLDRVDMVLIGGGNLLGGVDLYFPQRLRFLVKEANKKNRDVVLWGVGAGPLQSGWARRVLASALKGVKEVFCRDNYSASIIGEELKFKGRLKVIPDPALIGKGERRQRKGVGSPPTVGISVSPVFHPLIYPSGRVEAYRVFMAGFGDLLVRIFSRLPGHRLRLFSSERKDYFAVRAVYERLIETGLAAEVVEVDDLEALDGLMQEVDMVIGFRLHSLIIAASYLKPCFGLAWQSKARSFFETWLKNENYYKIEARGSGVQVNFGELEERLTCFIHSHERGKQPVDAPAKRKALLEKEYFKTLKNLLNP
jgi:polysaccharide pyruvyl transferase WcaK-like protein